jgi:hypothetical protein
MRQDYLNPGLPNSLVRDWLYYEDHATQPITSVQVWQVDWRRQREIVTYRLEYRCPTICALQHVTFTIYGCSPSWTPLSLVILNRAITSDMPICAYQSVIYP